MRPGPGTAKTKVLRGLVKPQLAGEIQIQNAAGALALLEAAGFDELLESGQVNVALGAVAVPGRAQIVADQVCTRCRTQPGSRRGPGADAHDSDCCLASR